MNHKQKSLSGNLSRPSVFYCIASLLLIMSVLYGTCSVLRNMEPNALGLSPGQIIAPGRIIERSIVDLPVDHIHIDVQSAASHPRQISVLVSWWGDVATVLHETHQTREGNTITIKMTTLTTKREGVYYPDIARLYQETVAIGALPSGDYKIIVNDLERQLRVD